jgi:3-oxoacyl-[acyl-carrier protein] reductase
VAADLAGRGFDIAIAYRESERLAGEVVDAARSNGARAIAVRADVSVAEQVDALVTKVCSDLSPPDVLVHCVGPYHRIDVLKETPAGWRAMLESNLDSFFLCARAVTPHMLERRWGRIVGFGMANAERAAGNPGITAHYIAKLGVIVLARTLARSLAPHGVTVNVVSPGFVASGSAPEEELAKMVKNIPAGYVGRVDDAVACVRFLVSEEAAYVNGTNIVVSGGWGL